MQHFIMVRTVAEKIEFSFTGKPLKYKKGHSILTVLDNLGQTKKIHTADAQCYAQI